MKTFKHFNESMEDYAKKVGELTSYVKTVIEYAEIIINPKSKDYEVQSAIKGIERIKGKVK